MILFRLGFIAYPCTIMMIIIIGLCRAYSKGEFKEKLIKNPMNYFVSQYMTLRWLIILSCAYSIQQPTADMIAFCATIFIIAVTIIYGYKEYTVSASKYVPSILFEAITTDIKSIRLYLYHTKTPTCHWMVFITFFTIYSFLFGASIGTLISETGTYFYQ